MGAIAAFAAPAIAAIGPALAATGTFLAANAGTLIQLAAVGASIGAAFLNRPPGVDREGPRLGDLSVSTSTYGNPIPEVFGANRMGVNMIWATEIEEQRSTISQGGSGKGGGNSSLTTYRYYANAAFGCCVGPVLGFQRIWADKKLIYDATDASNLFFKYPDGAIRTYNGDETQQPDPLIVADKGAAEAPAHRGLAYFVIEGFPLEDFGNRIPQFEVEVQTLASATFTEITTSGFAGVQVNHGTVDPGRRRFYFVEEIGVATQIHSVSLEDGSLLVSSDVYDDNVSNPLASDMPDHGGRPLVMQVDNRGRVWAQVQRFSLGAGAGALGVHMVQFEPNTMQPILVGPNNPRPVLTQFSPTGGVQFRTVGSAHRKLPGGLAAPTITIYYEQGDTSIPAGTTKGPGVIQIGQLDGADGLPTWDDSYLTPGSTADEETFLPNSTVIDNNGTVWLFGINETDSPDGDGKQFSVLRMPVALVVTASGLVANFTDQREIDLAAQGINAGAVFYDPPSNLFYFVTDPDSNGEFRLVCWDPLTESTVTERILDSTADADLVRAGGLAPFYGPSGLANGHLTYPVSGPTRTVRINASDFNDVEFLVYGTFTGTSFGPFWDSTTNQAFYWPDGTTNPGDGFRTVKYDRVTSTDPTLEDIITAFMEAAGIDPSEFSFDAGMSAKTVRGYARTRPMPVRNAIEPLAFAFDFDGVESDKKIKFVTRGGASVRTITSEDLDARPDGGSPGEETRRLIQTRQQEIELPARLDVRYIDEDRDHQEGNQHAKRHTSPNPTQQAGNVVNVQVPIVLDADKAKEIADVRLYNAYLERSRFAYQVPPKHMDLDPTDIVSVIQDGTTYRLRNVTQDDGDAMVQAFDTVEDQSEQYTPDVTGAATAILEQTIDAPGPTEIFVIDSPYLQDAQSTGNNTTGVYLAFGANTEAWEGATAEKSDDSGASFFQAANGNLSVPWGVLVAPVPALSTKKGDYPQAVEGVDRTTSITVLMIDGEDELESKTLSELVQTGIENAMYIFRADGAGEILQYTTVTDNLDGTFTFDGELLRGRRGTEFEAMAGHASGALVCFLPFAAVSRVQQDISEIGDTDFWRATTLRATFNQSPVKAITLEGRDLKPLAVTLPKADNPPLAQGGPATRDPVVITWNRRTRVGGNNDYNDDVDAVPLSESQEEYDVVLRNPGDTADAQVKTVTAETVSFTDAEQTTAGYSSGDALIIDVYQVSGEVGRGFVRRAVL